MFNISEQGWEHWVEMVNYPAPQPESYARDDDPGFQEDSELSLIFEDGFFYQQSIDGSKVALLLDLPGALPSSTVSAPPASSRERSVAPAVSRTLTSLPKGRRSTCRWTNPIPQRNQEGGTQSGARRQTAEEAMQARSSFNR
jgi:hypothetical protein